MGPNVSSLAHDASAVVSARTVGFKSVANFHVLNVVPLGAENTGAMSDWSVQKLQRAKTSRRGVDAQTKKANQLDVSPALGSVKGTQAILLAPIIVIFDIHQTMSELLVRGNMKHLPNDNQRQRRMASQRSVQRNRAWAVTFTWDAPSGLLNHARISERPEMIVLGAEV